MESSVFKKAGKYLLERKKQIRWKAFVSAFAVMVTLGTIVMLAMPAATLEKEAHCGIEEHVHMDECYEQVLICGYPDTPPAVLEEPGEGAQTQTMEADGADKAESGQAGHQHEESCYTQEQTLICEQEESEGHLHGEACYAITETQEIICGQEETEAHAHEESCYSVIEEKTEVCGLEEGADAHRHTEECYQTQQVLTCELEETQGAEANGSVPEETPAQTVPENSEAVPENGAHVHTQECYELKEVCGMQEHAHTQECYDNSFTCGQTEHAHADGCYDADGALICSMQEHAHVQRCRMPVFCGQTEHAHAYDCYIGPEASEEMRRWIVEVDTMIDALPSEEEIAQNLQAFDDAGDIDGYENYYLETSFQAGLAYTHYEALEEYQKYVVNSETLMQYSWSWEASTMEISEGTQYPITAINCRGSANSVGLVYGDGKTVKEAAPNGGGMTWWGGYVVESQDGGYVITRILEAKPSKENEVIPTGGFILFFHNHAPNEAWIGKSIDIDFDYTKPEINQTTNAQGFGSIWISGIKPKPEKNNGLQPIAAAETKDIIEINLYDYNANINNRYGRDTRYPGFQQDTGGADIPKSGEYNFGNMVTADLHTNPQKNITQNGTGPNQIYNSANSSLYVGGVSPMERTQEDGYPKLKNGIGLGYLFGAGDEQDGAVKKINGPGLDGLFQYNAETGEYTFDSRKNHAEYDEAGNRFLLYQETLSPNYLWYPFGNFMPFNKINTQATKASEIDRSYFEEMRQYAAYNQRNNVNGLSDGYQKLKEGMGLLLSDQDAAHPNGGWDGKTLIQDYFQNVGGNAGKNKNPDWYNSVVTEDAGLYNIDYDEVKDFFFGMSMEMNFVQPKGGRTGLDNAQPMIFDFVGDDDVWVYVDGAMFLDLSGIHRHVAGTIDFEEGKVYYYGFHSYAGGYGLGATTGKDVGEAPEKVETFEEILTAAYGADRAHELLKYETDENGNGRYTTFKDYGTHNFKFYYMERGSGSGVCKINFNFPVIPQNSIAIGKEIDTQGNADVLGNPDFQFQTLQKGASGNSIPEDLFLAPDTAYDVYVNGRKDRQETVDKNGIIRLKAGELAVISIKADHGEYFVRELFDADIFEQYGATVTVDGQIGAGKDLADVTIDGASFKGADSPVKNIDDDAVTLFQFVNRVDFAKTGSLSVTKKVVGSKAEREREFEFEITLDGSPLAEETPYQVETADGVQERTTDADGIIRLRADETAIVHGILAGSRYTVRETAASANGFEVSYQVEAGNGQIVLEEGAAFVQGIIAHKEVTAVTVVNAGEEFGSLVIEKRIADQKEEQVKDAAYAFRVYLENLASGQLEPYNGPYYLKDKDGYYHTKEGATDSMEPSEATVFGNAKDGVIADVSHSLRIEIHSIPAGTAFYVEEDKTRLDPNQYGEPSMEVRADTYETIPPVSDASGQIVSDKAIRHSAAAAEVIITNRVKSWELRKRSSSGEGLYLANARFAFIRQGEDAAAYLGESKEDGTVCFTTAAGEPVAVYEIAQGTYRMKETEAPAGYQLRQEEWTVVFTATGAVPQIYRTIVNASGEEVLEELTHTEDAEGNVTYYFDNDAYYVLPDAGGPGIYWYSIGGMLLMLAAVLILYKFRYGGALK